MNHKHFWSQRCYLMIVTPERWRQEGCHKFEASRDYIMNETLMFNFKQKLNKQTKPCFYSKKQGQCMQLLSHVPFLSGETLSQLNLSHGFVQIPKVAIDM